MNTDRQSSLVKITELENGIFKIILSDPSHQNTLSEKMIDELQSAFHATLSLEAKLGLVKPTTEQ